MFLEDCCLRRTPLSQWHCKLSTGPLHTAPHLCVQGSKQQRHRDTRSNKNRDRSRFTHTHTLTKSKVQFNRRSAHSEQVSVVNLHVTGHRTCVWLAIAIHYVRDICKMSCHLKWKIYLINVGRLLWTCNITLLFINYYLFLRSSLILCYKVF